METSATFQTRGLTLTGAAVSSAAFFFHFIELAGHRLEQYFTFITTPGVDPGAIVPSEGKGVSGRRLRRFFWWYNQDKSVPHPSTKECPKCNGTGFIECPACYNTETPGEKVCPICKGKGTDTEGYHCKQCDGNQSVPCERCGGTAVLDCPVCKPKR